jgi:hypothetical protein
MIVALGVMGTALALVACSTTDNGKSGGQPAASVTPQTASVVKTGEGVRVSDKVTMRATVVAIDHKQRVMTLRGEEGNEQTFKIGPEVRNFPQVRKGDEVVATYYESIAVKLRKPGEASPGVTSAQNVVRAAPGEKPGAAMGETVSVTATVQKVDRKKQTVTLKGPEGRVVTVKVPDPDRLAKVKEKDLVEVTYTEALAIAVEKPTK